MNLKIIPPSKEQVEVVKLINVSLDYEDSVVNDHAAWRFRGTKLLPSALADNREPAGLQIWITESATTPCPLPS